VVLDLDADADPELFAAAQVSLGALGVVTRMTLQNRSAYKLKAREWVQRTEERARGFRCVGGPAPALRDVSAHPFGLRHHPGHRRDRRADDNPPVARGGCGVRRAMRGWMQLPPRERRRTSTPPPEQIEPSERVDASYRILSNVRNNRFNEMEYSVPWTPAPNACARC
jgi:hypothetical protein